MRNAECGMRSADDGRCFVFRIPNLARGLAVREESVSHNLRRLPSGYVVAGAEVRPLLRVAWLVGAATIIASYYLAGCEPLDELVEGVGGRHVGKGLLVVLFCEVGSVGHYLR